MAHIVPFKAVRPSKKHLQYFSSKSYKNYTEEELQNTLAKNPLSFLSIIHLKKHLSDSMTKAERYMLVKNKYEDFKATNVLIKDETPAFYIYETVQGDGHLFCGIIAGASVKDYNTNVIKKHEATITKREKTFKSYLKAVRFNAAPILLTFTDDSIIEKGIQNAKENAREIQSWDTENESHKIWCIDHMMDVDFIQTAFKKIPSLYIADGHHRSASSALLAAEIDEDCSNHKDAAYTHFLSYLIPEKQLKIYDYNRLIKNLNGLTSEEFLEKVKLTFEVKKKGHQPYISSKKHEISMYLAGRFYSLSLRKSKQEFGTAISQLDTYILQTKLLEPILGITNIRTDKRISYVHGKDSMNQIKTAIDSGNQAVGFGLFPIQIQELKAIADSKAVMPPKSTYIYPKLRSGNTIYEF